MSEETIKVFCPFCSDYWDLPKTERNLEIIEQVKSRVPKTVFEFGALPVACPECVDR